MSQPRAGTPHIQDERYRPLQRLGRGRSSWVFRALDTVSEQQVAVRIFARRDDEDGGALSAALDALPRLRHERLVPVHFASIIEGHPYVVSELRSGSTLAALLEQGHVFSADEAMVVLRDVLEGLAAAHAAGVCHGELSPDKIWVDDEGRAVLDEVGQLAIHPPARPVGASAPFVAPEHRRGPRRASPSGDVYAVGVVLHAMLGGAQVLDFSSVALDAEVPATARVLLRRCTAQAPEQRYRDAAEALGAMAGRARAEEPSTPGPSPALSTPGPSIGHPAAQTGHEAAGKPAASPERPAWSPDMIYPLAVMVAIAAGIGAWVLSG